MTDWTVQSVIFLSKYFPNTAPTHIFRFGADKAVRGASNIITLARNYLWKKLSIVRILSNFVK